MHPSQDSFYPNSPCYAEFYGPRLAYVGAEIIAKDRLDKCLLTHNEIDPTPFSQTDRLKLKMPSSDLIDFLDFSNPARVPQTFFPEPTYDINKDDYNMAMNANLIDWLGPLSGQYGLEQDSIVNQLTVDELIPSLEPQTINPLELEQTRSEKIETIFVPQITERFTIQREESNGKLEKFIMFGVIGLALFLLK